MEYHVPQFIDVEDKLIGPLTLKQFIYVAGASGLIIIFFSYLPTMFAFLFGIPVAGAAAALAFYKINKKPLISMLEYAFNYYTSKKLMLWKHTSPTKKETRADIATTNANEASSKPTRGAPRLTRGKLSELAWSLDVNPSINNERSS